jgi:hypothetical protein
MYHLHETGYRLAFSECAPGRRASQYSAEMLRAVHGRARRLAI